MAAIKFRALARVVLSLGWATILAACTPAPSPPTSTQSATHHPVVTETIPAASTIVPKPDSGPTLQPSSISQLPPPAPAPASLALIPDSTITDFAQAESISLTAAGDDTFAIIGHEETLFVTRANESQPFEPYTPVNLDAPALVLAVERPAIAVNAQGTVAVAWVEPTAVGVSVWYASSTDAGATFSSGIEVATTQEPETFMVRLGFDSGGNPLLTWLEGGRLEFARSPDGGTSFNRTEIDEEVCDCCQPQPVDTGQGIVVAYRNLEHDSQNRDYRDVHVIRSLDGGQTFEAPLPVADEHWFLNACPISGPALVAHSGMLYAAWMDARNDFEGTLASSDIWFASSNDSGATFTPDQRLNISENDYNTLPVIAVGPGGRIHVAWEAQGEDGAAIVYTTSDDGGHTFSPPVSLVNSNDTPERGRVGKPTLAITELGTVYLGWLDKQGARIATWVDLK